MPNRKRRRWLSGVVTWAVILGLLAGGYGVEQHRAWRDIPVARAAYAKFASPILELSMSETKTVDVSVPRRGAAALTFPLSPAATAGQQRLDEFEQVITSFESARGFEVAWADGPAVCVQNTRASISGQGITVRLTGCYNVNYGEMININDNDLASVFQTYADHSTALDDPYPALVAATEEQTRHDEAHIDIKKKCGSIDPPIVGQRTENVTDAYAHLYLGANTDAGGYGFTPADVVIAQRIKAGTCD